MKNERGKNWQRPKMVDSNNPTAKVPTPAEEWKIAHAPTLDSQKNPEIAKQQKVQQIRQSTHGWTVAIVLTALASGAGLTLSTMALTKSGPFAPKDKQEEVDPPKKTEKEDPVEEVEKPEIPDVIEDSKTLYEVIKDNNLQLKASDFNYETKQPQLHAKALRYDSKKTEWKPVNERITRTQEQNLLVGVQLRNPVAVNSITSPDATEKDLRKWLKPKGFSYSIIAQDRDDPTIAYLLWNCEDKAKYGTYDKKDALLSEVGFYLPGHKKAQWFRSFHVPMCQKNE